MNPLSSDCSKENAEPSPFNWDSLEPLVQPMMSANGESIGARSGAA